MNAEAADLLWSRQDDIDQAGGQPAFRQLALKDLKLKSVIKVSAASIVVFPALPATSALRKHTTLVNLVMITSRCAAGKSLLTPASVGLQLY